MDKNEVTDKEIADLVAKTVPDNPREWYWALMDYGTYLKQNNASFNTLSKHYSRQSSFSGSRRQVRGQVLRALVAGPLDMAALQGSIPDKRLQSVLQDLSTEGFIQQDGKDYKLVGS